MSFPRYPRYKDSGVEWLGEVPGHWDLRRIGYFFTERREKVSDKDFPALSVTKNGIVPQLDTAAKSDDGDNRKRVCKGDFVINSRSDRKGSSGASELDGSVSLICTVMQPQEKVHTPFVHHLLRSELFQEEFYRYGKGIVADLWSTNYSEMRNILLGMPTIPEQAQIAAFLDCETAKIDGLVAEQRRLMELLKEKRQAVISHAITKGLNPNAPMKHSGIEWLGDVPEHWEETKLSRLTTKIGDGLHGTPEYMDESPFRFINGNNLIDGAITLTETTRSVSKSEFEKHSVDLDQTSVLLSINGTIGNLALFRGELVMLGKSAAYINCGDKLKREYLCFYLKSSFISRYFEHSVTGTTIFNLSLDSVRRLPMVLPLINEQEAIIAYLDTESAKFDTLIAEAQRAIDLLQEHRTALISAAVTGQIDVRQLTEMEPA